MNAYSLVVVLLVAALGGAASAFVFRPEPPAAPTAAASPEALRAEFAALAERVAALERIALAPVAAAVAVDAPPPGREAVGDADLRRRLDELERRLLALPATAAGSAAPAPAADAASTAAAFAAEAERAARRVADHRAAILAPATTEAEKMAGWRGLRGTRDGWTDEVVATMANIGLTSPDPAVRADVWRQASGRQHAALGPALLQALRSDGDARAREEAAETLAYYIDDAAVRAALESAAAGDPDDDVRRQAARSLAPRRR